MLVLSATGAPVALVKILDEGMVNSGVAVWVEGGAYPSQGEPRITLQKFADLKSGSLSAFIGTPHYTDYPGPSPYVGPK